MTVTEPGIPVVIEISIEGLFHPDSSCDLDFSSCGYYCFVRVELFFRADQRKTSPASRTSFNKTDGVCSCHRVVLIVGNTNRSATVVTDFGFSIVPRF
ncbi:MAG: hypothetical protein GY820_47160 [Gammaproteobacteria bacterium]|nr:hypothetical protein [Gammaproteobacteria bacterium]